MRTNWKPFLYQKKKDAVLDEAFRQAESFGRLKLGSHVIFWELGFQWYVVPVGRVRKAYRRVEDALTKVGCRTAVMDIQKLMLVLDDGSLLELQVCEGNALEAERLFARLQTEHPEIQFGK